MSDKVLLLIAALMTASLIGCGNTTTDYSSMPPLAPPADPTKDPLMQSASEAVKAKSDAPRGTGGAPAP